MSDYMGDWMRYLGMTNAPAVRWVSPQEDTEKNTGYFKVAYDSAYYFTVADLENGAVPRIDKLVPDVVVQTLKAIDKATVTPLLVTLTGVGTTTIPVVPKDASDSNEALPVNTKFGWSRELQAWIYVLPDDTYMSGY